MPDLFLSYSRDDSLIMGVIRDNLRKLGFNLWIDIEKLEVGTRQWERGVREAILSVDAMIVLCSPSAEKSEWVNTEIHIAKLAKKTIIPVVILGTDLDAIPTGLIRVQYCDMRGRSNPTYGFRELVKRLAKDFSITVPRFELETSDLLDIPTVQVVNIVGNIEGNINVVTVGRDVSGEINIAGEDIVQTQDKSSPSKPEFLETEVIFEQEKYRQAISTSISLLPNPQNAILKIAVGSKKSIHSISFSPGGKLLVSAGYDKVIRLWDASTGNLLKELEGHQDSISSVTFSNVGDSIISASRDQTVKVWETRTGHLTQTIEGHTDWVMSVACSRKGKWLVSASQDHTVKIWEIASGRLINTLQGHTDSVLNASFSPQSNWIISASCDTTVKIWSAGSGRLLGSYEGHQNRVRSAVFSPDSNLIVSTSEDRSIRVWETLSRKSICKLRYAPATVMDAVFFYGTEQILSVYDDGAVRIWETYTGKLLKTLKGHKGPAFTISSSPDGTRIASASHDGTIIIWDAVDLLS